MNSTSDFIETADIETSSEDYAARFSGAVGAWFLKIQEEATLQMLRPYAGATVLDVGGGHGQLTRALVQNEYRVTVLGSADVCQARIANFVHQGRCSFNIGNILSLPYPDRAFDVVISYRLLPHVSRWPQLIGELTRVARTAVLIDYPAMRSFNWIAPYLFTLKKNFEGNTRPFTCFSETELLEVFGEFGFVRRDRYPEFFLPMILHKILKWPLVSSRAEALFRLLGITSCLGSPVILKLVRAKGQAQLDRSTERTVPATKISQEGRVRGLTESFVQEIPPKSAYDEWPIRLYRKSVLKQRKIKEITALLGPTEDLHCLDVGGDNGVVSYLLRLGGGKWKSADLDEQAVRSIRELVRDAVFQIDGYKTCFQDDEFDRVIIVDFLEHIRTDAEFVKEIFRILRPGGELIVNVPHVKNSLLRKFRHAIGETDEKHGHIRPGYTLDGLRDLLWGQFTIVAWNTYSKFFSESIDTLVNFGSGRLKKGAAASSKGLIVTGKDLIRNQKIFRVYSFTYPVLWLIAKLDGLLFWTSGYMLIVKAIVNKGGAQDPDDFPDEAKQAGQTP
jgi:ubiquinone/menaquinone biosynthesis C-methylase UbiE